MALEGGDPTPLLPMAYPQSPFPQGHPANPQPGLVSPRGFLVSKDCTQAPWMWTACNSSKELSYYAALLAGPVNCRQPISPTSLTLFSFGVPPQLLLQADSGLSEGKPPAPTLSGAQVKLVTSTFEKKKKDYNNARIRLISLHGFAKALERWDYICRFDRTETDGSSTLIECFKVTHSQALNLLLALLKPELLHL